MGRQPYKKFYLNPSLGNSRGFYGIYLFLYVYLIWLGKKGVAFFLAGKRGDVNKKFILKNFSGGGGRLSRFTVGLTFTYLPPNLFFWGGFILKWRYFFL